MKIWAMFSIYNDYDQPENNLEVWWKNKPSFKELGKALGITVNMDKGNANIGRLLKGQEVRIGGADYRLEEIKEGKKL